MFQVYRTLLIQLDSFSFESEKYNILLQIW